MIGYIALSICFFIFGYQYAVRRKREMISPNILDIRLSMKNSSDSSYKNQEEWLQSNWRKMLRDLAE